MRIWSLHPKYLDPPGLVALWREGLLAQAVLSGKMGTRPNLALLPPVTLAFLPVPVGLRSIIFAG
jgi:hypothetical protein